MALGSNFIFVTCQSGAEGALKEEIERDGRGFRSAFSRPGFVTFKTDVSLESNILTLNSVFARTLGISLGLIKEEKLSERIRALKQYFIDFPTSPRLHFWRRDIESDLHPDKVKELEGLEDTARKAIYSTYRFDSQSQWILDVIEIDSDHWAVGYHRVDQARTPFEGGNPRWKMSTDVPSRAFLKMEEAIQLAGIPMKPKDIAVELGSAPGGSAYSLLKRGLSVVGVDPGLMDRRILNEFPDHFMHIREPVSALRRGDFPERVDWLISDMNVTPNITLAAIDRLQSRMQDTLLGCLVTLKLSEWNLTRAAPDFLDHFHRMGFGKVWARQLFYSKQEFFVFGLTKMGAERVSQPKITRKVIRAKPADLTREKA